MKHLVKTFNDYSDIELTFEHFLRCSLLSSWEYFNWTLAFERPITTIRDKLASHGQLSFEDFQEYEEGYYCLDDISNYAVSTPYIKICKDELHMALLEYRYNKFKQAFSGYFDNLLDILYKYEKLASLKQFEKIALFDTVIHAQHVTGEVFEDVNIEALKENIEQEYFKYTIK